MQTPHDFILSFIQKHDIEPSIDDDGINHYDMMLGDELRIVFREDAPSCLKSFLAPVFYDEETLMRQTVQVLKLNHLKAWRGQFTIQYEARFFTLCYFPETALYDEKDNKALLQQFFSAARLAQMKLRKMEENFERNLIFPALIL